MTPDKSQLPTVVVPFLPHKIKVQGFLESYIPHLEEHAYQWKWLGIPALIIFLIGAVTVLFGPSHIYYNALTGPTFFQFIQMYPGPIATVGGLLFSLNAWMGKPSAEAILDPCLYLLVNYNVEINGEPVDLECVGLKYLENAEFELFELEEDASGV